MPWKQLQIVSFAILQKTPGHPISFIFCRAPLTWPLRSNQSSVQEYPRIYIPVILTPPAKKKKKKIQIIESCSVWLITTRALSHFLGHQRSSKSTCIISKHPPSRGLLSILGHGQFLLSPTPPLLPQNRAQSSAKSLVPRPPTRPYTLTSCHSTTTNNNNTHTHTHTHTSFCSGTHGLRGVSFV